MTAGLLPGTLLGDTYRIVRQVGAGGMGAVYEAEHARLTGRYAVKVLLAEISNRADVFLRFRREAEVTSALRHPNIVQVVDFNQTTDGYPYLVMEFLEGTELADEIARVGAMPVRRALDIVGQAASALTAAHHRKIVHRDLKPQNMFLVRLPEENREILKIVDFGISKVREATTALTQESAVMGTPQYMAPEQAMGRLADIDARTDEFALAAITYELLTGRTPFQGETVHAVLYQVVHEMPTPMREFLPSLDPALEAVVMKGLSKARDDRYPSVLAFHHALMTVASQEDRSSVEMSDTLPAGQSFDGQPGVAHATTLGLAAGARDVSASSPSRARRWRIGILVGAIMAAATTSVLVLRTRPSSSPNPTPTSAAVAPPVPTPVAPVPPAPSMATVEVEDGPPGLEVTVDGASSRLPIQLPRGSSIHTLVFRAPGYQPRELRVDGMREHRSLVLEMNRIVPETDPSMPERSTPPSRSGATHASGRRAKATSPVSRPSAPSPANEPNKPGAAKKGLILDF